MRAIIAYIILVPLLVALIGCALAWLVDARPQLAAWVIFKRLPGRTRWITAVTLMAFALTGADKGVVPSSARIAQFVTALRSGVLLDDSGRIGSAATMAVVTAFEAETQAIIDSASNVVAAAQSDFAAAAFLLTNRNLTAAYIAMDLPRAEAHSHTNSNIAATIERLQQIGNSNLVAWVWFSEHPAIAPTLAFDFSAAANVWGRMTSITNSYPDETEVNGIPCVAYTFEIPTAMRGVVMRPEYEVGFGGSNTNDYLIVPRGGVMVETNGFYCSPYTGWDLAHPAPFGTNLAVRYVGGVAVEALWHGTNYTGRML